MTRDRVRNAIRRAHTDTLHNTRIEVYEPSVSYTQGEGWDVSYPSTPNSVYDARVESPDATEEKQRSGTDVEIDAIVRVRDDTGQQWTGWGEEETAAVRVLDANDQTTYEVQTVVTQHDGTVEMEVVEV